MHKVYLGILWYLIFLVSVVIHEVCHAWAAKKGGDETAFKSGQLTIDPLPHLRREPFGMILLPLLSIAYFDWPIGYAHVPYDMSWAMRYPKRAALMSLAGPLSNVLIALVCLFLIRFGLSEQVFTAPKNLKVAMLTMGNGETLWNSLAMVLSMLLSMNLIMAVFNLLPFPPLDGSAVLPVFLSKKMTKKYQKMMSQPMFSFLGLFLAWNLFPNFFPHILHACLTFLYA